MNLGEKLRQYRQDRNMTQPQLAEAMGIEQSYLSKLENGKSLPSNDVLNRILDVFAVDVGELLDGLDQGVRNQLRQIPDVGDFLRREKELIIGNRRRWMLVSAVLVALGSALLYAGSVQLFFPGTVYGYRSNGVIRDGESKELFEDYPVPGDASREEQLRIRDAIAARVDQRYFVTTSYRGERFNELVDGGSRTYYLRERNQVSPWQNKAVASVGVFMLIFGVIGLTLERKLARGA